MKLRKVLWLGLVLILMIQGCGYRLSGTGSTLPPHLKTIYVPIFQNTSSEPTIQRQLTTVIRQAFLSDGRMKLVTEEKEGDLILNGTLNFYDIRAVAFDSNDVATEYWVYLGVNVVAFDRKKDKVYLKDQFRTRWDYRPTADVVNAEANRQEALEEAYRDVAIRLVSVVIDQF